MQTSAEFVIPAIENCCDKEAYAFAGLAFYWASVLEHGALNLAVVLALPEVNVLTQNEFEAIFEDLSRKTLGQLLKTAREVIKLSARDEEIIQRALSTRNELIHSFFRSHAEDFVSEQGRHEMKSKLSEMVLEMKEADFTIERLYTPLWEKYGVDDAFVERQMAELRAEAEKRDGSA